MRSNAVLLSDAVLDRMPFLRNANVRFFDFGNIQILDNTLSAATAAGVGAGLATSPDGTTTDPRDPRGAVAQQRAAKSNKNAFAGVIVITDEAIAFASFPAQTAGPYSVTHQSVVGVSRDGQAVIVRNSVMNDLKLTLPKCDAFVVHLLGIQDRLMNRTLRLAGEATSKSPRDTDPNAVRRAMTLAQELHGGPGAGGAAASGGAATPGMLAASDASMERLWGVIRLGRGSARAAPPTTELDEGSDASSVQTIQHVADSPREGDPADMEASSHGGDAGPLPVEEAEVPPMVTDAASLKRRLWYFFMYYDQSRLAYIDTLCSMHAGSDGKQLMKELETQYGPEPHRFRWSIRDQTIYQREVNSQLRAQLARAQDELLLLKENSHEKAGAVDRVLARKNELVAQMLGESGTNANDSATAAASNPAMMGSASAAMMSQQQQQQAAAAGGGAAATSAAAPNTATQAQAVAAENWRQMFTSVATDNATAQRMYNVISFYDIVEPPERALIEWSVICLGNFWGALKEQVLALGPVRTTPPLLELTNEDVREMLICNRDFFLAWLAEAHGECTLHLRHVDGSFCFMSASEAFPHVTVGLS